MGSWILFLLISFVCFLMVKYRQQVGDMLGSPEWASKVGGIYNVVVILALFIFFWSLATVTGTTQVLFSPFINSLPGR